MSSFASKYNEAFKCIENAKWYEKSGDLSEAKKLYVQGIGYFMEIMKLETNGSRKQIIEQNINDFIQRAEALQSQTKHKTTNENNNNDNISTFTRQKTIEERLTEMKDDHTPNQLQSINEIQTTQTINIQQPKHANSEEQSVKELTHKVQMQSNEISTINQKMSSLQKELEQKHNQNTTLNEEINALKENNNILTENASNLYLSLEKALSFGNDSVYRWYKHIENENDDIFVVKIKDNKMVYLDGTIECDKETQPTPHKLNDINALCKYVVHLRENTEDVLSKIEITDDNDENKNDSPKVARQPSVYECLICMDAAPDMFNYPCGHVCYCSTCAEEVIKENKTCPNCREEIFQCINIIYGGFKQEQ